MSNDHLPRSPKYWPAAVFLFGWYILPTGRARNLYCMAFAAYFIGLAVMNFDTSPGHGAKQPWEVMTPSVWSLLLWVFGIFCHYLMFSEVRAHRRAQRTAAVAPVAAPSAPVTPVPQPRPVAPAPATRAPDPKPAAPTPSRLHMATQTASGLHIPSHTRRRVRRGGQTLSGTPIKDRRTVDPRSL